MVVAGGIFVGQLLAAREGPILSKGGTEKTQRGGFKAVPLPAPWARCLFPAGLSAGNVFSPREPCHHLDWRKSTCIMSKHTMFYRYLKSNKLKRNSPQVFCMIRVVYIRELLRGY